MQVEKLGGPRLRTEALAEATGLSMGAIGRRLRGDWDEADLAEDTRRRLDPGEPAWAPAEAISIARYAYVSPGRLLVMRGVLSPAEVILAAAEMSVPIPELMEAAEAMTGKPRPAPRGGISFDELDTVMAKLRERKQCRYKTVT